MLNIKPSNPIILALDKAGKEGAIQTILEVGRNVWGYKIGQALIYRYGISLFGEIRERCGSVNLLIELQLMGTPRSIIDTISVFSLYGTEIGYIVVNANSGSSGIKAAVQTARLSRVLVGSVLDSLDFYDIKYIYDTNFPEEKTFQFAMMAKQEKAAGICFPSRDLEFLSRYSRFNDLIKIVFGVRPSWYPDQGTHEHVLTPREARERGADMFVIGDPIMRAEDKKKAIERILEEIYF